MSNKANVVYSAVAGAAEGCSSVLEVGCGSGGWLRRLSYIPKRVGIEVHRETLEAAKRKNPTATIIQGDLHNKVFVSG